MLVESRTGISAAIITFNNHFGNNGLVVENDNRVLILQGPGRLEKNCFSTLNKKLEIVNTALRKIKSSLHKFEKVIIYIGDGLGFKIIKLVAKCGFPAEKVLFLVSEDEWGEKEGETLLSSSLASSGVIKYEEKTSDVIWNVYRKILVEGIFPQ